LDKSFLDQELPYDTFLKERYKGQDDNNVDLNGIWMTLRKKEEGAEI
jgi:hypothetical protein